MPTCLYDYNGIQHRLILDMQPGEVESSDQQRSTALSGIERLDHTLTSTFPEEQAILQDRSR